MKFVQSHRALQLKSSAIREILKITENPEVISLAGGLPSPQTFPIELMNRAYSNIFATSAKETLQYSTTEGFMPLRQVLAKRFDVSVDWVTITTGSQQGIDLLAKAFIDPGSKVLVEIPTYLGALQAFSLFEPTCVQLPCDDLGIVPERIDQADILGARLAYTQPNFQNPSGRRLPLERRKKIVDIMKAANVLILEDDPYGELIYSGSALPSLFSFNPEGVVYMGSFSKTVAPGLRVGYSIAQPEIAKKLVQFKQAADLHTCGLAQRLVHEVLSTGFFPDHVNQIRKLYHSQRDAMLASLERHCKSCLKWNVPEGGMFLWASAPKGINSEQLLKMTLDEKNETRVAFVPGIPFYANEPNNQTFRLSFVTVPPGRIEQGVTQIAKSIEQCFELS